MPAHQTGLVGVPAGIVDGVDAVEDRTVGGKGVAGDGDDHAVAPEPEQFAVLVGGRACDEPFRGRVDEKSAVVEMAVEGEPRCGGDLAGQPDALGKAPRQHGTMPRDGRAVDEAQAVEQQQRLGTVIGQLRRP